METSQVAAPEHPHVRIEITAGSNGKQSAWVYEMFWRNQVYKVFKIFDGHYDQTELELICVLAALADRKKECVIDLWVSDPFAHMHLTNMLTGKKVSIMPLDTKKLAAQLKRHEVTVLLKDKSNE